MFLANWTKTVTVLSIKQCWKKYWKVGWQFSVSSSLQATPFTFTRYVSHWIYKNSILVSSYCRFKVTSLSRSVCRLTSSTFSCPMIKPKAVSFTVFLQKDDIWNMFDTWRALQFNNGISGWCCGWCSRMRSFNETCCPSIKGASCKLSQHFKVLSP